MNTYRQQNSLSSQRGAVLVIALLFLVILTMLGVSSMTTTTLEEKMAGNARDYNLALQAAEAALRDAERDIRNVAAISTFTAVRTSPISGATDFDASCTNGLCLPTVTTCTAGATNATEVLSKSFTAAPSVQYGTYTGATSITGVAAQPRYLIEAIRVCPIGQNPSNKIFYYRVTARGVGANTNTQVTLQQVFRP